MNNLIIIGIVIVAIIAIAYFCLRENFVSYKSEYDNREYNVLQKYPNHQEAAELMAKINSAIIRLHKHLREKYQIYFPEMTPAELASRLQISEESLIARQRAISNVLNRYNPEVLYETNPQNLLGETSSTIDKGKKMYFCLRYRDNPIKLVPYHVILYVTLHEISHVAADVWGHPPEFWSIFKFILIEAQESGVYEPINYAEYPEKYCGIVIAENTLLDDSITSI